MLVSLLWKAFVFYMLFKIARKIFHIFVGYQVLKEQAQNAGAQNSGQNSAQYSQRSNKDVFEAEYRVKDSP